MDGELLQENFENIYWSICAVRCLNLILKDIGSLSHMVELTKKASKVTTLIYIKFL